MDDRYEIANIENLFSEHELRVAAGLASRSGQVPSYWHKRDLATYLVQAKGWYASDVRKALAVTR